MDAGDFSSAGIELLPSRMSSIVWAGGCYYDTIAHACDHNAYSSENGRERASPLIVRAHFSPSKRVDLWRGHVPTQGLGVLPLVIHPLLSERGWKRQGRAHAT